MTVGKKFQTMLSNLKSCQADLENFALETDNQAAKSLYTSCASQIQNTISSLEQRWNELQQEEPQYKTK